MKSSVLSEKDGPVKTFIILCDGGFPERGPGREILEKARKSRDYVIVACDGAALSLMENGMEADYIVGDMDTLPKKYQRIFKAKIHKEEEQDFNDLCKAFRFTLGLISQPSPEVAQKTAGKSSPENTDSRIVILGATGKREDHALGNISYLPDFALSARNTLPRKSISISMVTDYGVFIPVLDTTRLKGEPGDRLSIFAFDQTLQIKSTGLQYKTDDVVFDMWWKATLNIFKKRNVLLKFSHPAKAILYFPF